MTSEPGWQRIPAHLLFDLAATLCTRLDPPHRHSREGGNPDFLCIPEHANTLDSRLRGNDDFVVFSFPRSCVGMRFEQSLMPERFGKHSHAGAWER